MLTTQAEREKLAADGVGYGIREKCDRCRTAILECLTWRNRQTNEILCRKCATGRNELKVGGLFLAGSDLAHIYQAMQDGKWHTTNELKDKVKDKFKQTFARCAEEGKKAGLFHVEIGESEARLVFDKKERTVKK